MIFYHPKYKRRLWQWLRLKTTGFQMIRWQRIKKALRTRRTEYRYLPLNEMDIFHLSSCTRITDQLCKRNQWIIAPPLWFFLFMEILLQRSKDLDEKWRTLQRVEQKNMAWHGGLELSFHFSFALSSKDLKTLVASRDPSSHLWCRHWSSILE